MVHLLILLISGRRQLHLVAQLLLGLGLVVGTGETSHLAVVLDDLVGVQNLVNDLVVRPRVLEEIVIHLAATSWIDSHEVASSLVLLDSLSNVLFVLKVGCFLKWFEEGGVLLRVFVAELLDIGLELVAATSTVDLLVQKPVWS